MTYTDLEQRYELACETSKKQLATIQHQRQQIETLQLALEQAQSQLRRIAAQSQTVQDASFQLRTEVIAADVQLKLADVACDKFTTSVAISAPATSITIGADGRHE